MDLGLKGRVAVVGGASKGLGRACALALAQEGAKVAICSRGAEQLEMTAQEIRSTTGTEVLAVPGSPLDPRAKGCNDLIRQGAALCEGAEDVLRALEGLRGFREPDRRYAADPGPPPDDGLRDRVAALLSPTPVSRDEIVRAVGAPAPVVFAALVELSLAGRAELQPGGMVVAG